MRTVAEVAKTGSIVDAPLTVQNRPGGLTTTWEKTMITQHKGDDDQISVASLSTVLLDVEERSEYTLDDVTLLGGLVQENFAIVAAGDSQYQDLDAVMAALKKDPKSVKVASQLEDTLAFALLAEEAGVDASKVTFVSYEGGGEQATGVMNSDVDIAVAGVSEFVGLMQSGDLKGLAVIGKDAAPGLDVPTTADLGYETEFANWRALIGPPDMPAYAVDYWEDAIGKITSSDSWKKVAERNNWTTTYRTGDELQTLVDDTYKQITAAEDDLGRTIIP
ncbi:tripartite tricarboxylate transporter substrate-binding protein [Nocardioides sp. YIM B13467]|uniref:tripartite tricarboxylate transporter substrate-binding protein n=1 Tax=Nocardioides sp. YIM B13467 TaxID=3366294 RepID=UPI00366BE137